MERERDRERKEKKRDIVWGEKSGDKPGYNKPEIKKHEEEVARLLLQW